MFSTASVSSNTQQSKLPYNGDRSALPTAGFETLLIIAKGEPMETGKFSPKQQPEGPILHELDIASEEQTSCLDSRVQTSSVTQPWCICMCEEEAACSGL